MRGSPSFHFPSTISSREIRGAGIYSFPDVYRQFLPIRNVLLRNIPPVIRPVRVRRYPEYIPSYRRKHPINLFSAFSMKMGSLLPPVVPEKQLILPPVSFIMKKR